MKFIEQELERISATLREPRTAEYDQLYAAQQALSWALDPTVFKSPYDLLNGTPAGSVNCPAS